MNIIETQAAHRQERLRILYNSVDKVMRANGNVNEEKLIAEAQFQFASARRTILEYLKQLEISGSIVRDEGKVWTADGYKAELILKKSEVPIVEKIQEVKP